MPQTIFDFVKTRRARWDRLAAMCDHIDREGLGSLDAAHLVELGSVYRQVASDLAFVQSYYPGSELLELLNALVARAHSHVYQTGGGRLAGFRTTVLRVWPRTFRANLRYFRAALTVFLLAALAGAAASLADERLAPLFLSQGIIDSIHRHEMWTDQLFAIIPGSFSAFRIMANNLLVSYFVFAGGIAFGLGSLFILAVNGMMVGAVIALCARHGMAVPLFNFMTGHGVVELSAIIVCGAAGLILGEAVLAPGRLSRKDALRTRGPEAVRLVVMGTVFLIMSALVEGYFSPSHALPAAAKITFGLLFGAFFYAYVFFAGRGEAAGDRGQGTEE